MVIKLFQSPNIVHNQFSTSAMLFEKKYQHIRKEGTIHNSNASSFKLIFS